MEIIVQKYGGTSVENKEKLILVANRIIDTYNKGNKVVVVVSAQGNTTDNLISKINEYTENTHDREMDLMLSTGEIQTVALLTMMLKDRGYSAISLTGEQAGVITNGEYGRAKILKVIKENIQKYINDGNIVVIAGFQGIDKFGNINTLGRGGSDLSAVAIAVELGAKECQIYTDVDGIYSSDPRIIKKAKLLKEVSYEEILEAATAGAKVLHNRSVSVGKLFNMPIVVSGLKNDVKGTRVVSRISHDKKVDDTRIIENYGAKIITKSDEISKITVVGESMISCPDHLSKIFETATKNNIQIMMITFSEMSINIIVKKSDGEKFIKILHDELIDNE